MNMSDSALIFGMCGLFVALPILGVIGVFVAGRYSKRNAQQQIPMEGATCTETLQGDIVIEGNLVRDSLIIGFFGFTLAVAVLGAVGTSGRDRLTIWLLAFVWGCITVPTIWRLSKTLMNARYRFKAGERTLVVKKGRQQRAFGFAELAELKVTCWRTELRLRYGARSYFFVGRLELTLKSGETWLLGMLSSYKGMDELQERTDMISGMIAGMTGVKVTKVDQTEAAKAEPS